MLDEEMKQRLLLFLKDDACDNDITSKLVPQKKAKALLKANEDCVLAGVEEAVFLFEHVGCAVKKLKEDGEDVKKGGAVLEIEGENRNILSVERTALNVLGRMSGVATICREAEKIAGNNTTIALTRKTIPGFNVFDKRAAQVAGAWPHRKNLAEAVLIKDNHLMFVGIKEAVAKARGTNKTVEVEVENLSQVKDAIASAPDMIMLDNFSSEDAGAAVKEIRSKNRKTRIEISGGISLETLAEYAKLKPDYISLGLLTKTARMVDFSLDVL